MTDTCTMAPTSPCVCVYSECVSKEPTSRTAACDKSTGPKREKREGDGGEWREREAHRSRKRKGLQSCAERKRKMVSRRVGLGILDWARQPILARIRQVIRQVILQSRRARLLRHGSIRVTRSERIISCCCLQVVHSVLYVVAAQGSNCLADIFAIFSQEY